MGLGHGQKRPGLARLPPASTAGFIAGIRQRPERTDFSPWPFAALPWLWTPGQLPPACHRSLKRPPARPKARLTDRSGGFTR